MVSLYWLVVPVAAVILAALVIWLVQGGYTDKYHHRIVGTICALTALVYAAMVVMLLMQDLGLHAEWMH